MAKLPRNTVIGMEVTVQTDLEFTTLITSFDDNMKEQRKRKSLYQRRNMSMKYKHLTLADARTLWQFFNARYGRYLLFHFVLPYWDTYVNEYVATADGVTTLWDLPTENISTETVYLDGSPTESYDINAAAGADSNDQIEFDAAPGLGTKITLDFTGNLVINCRFDDDGLSFKRFRDKFTSLGMKLHGLLWDEL